MNELRSMSPDTSREALDAFEVAVSVPARERSEHLQARCGHREDLRREVESLLRAHDEVTSGSGAGFLEQPAFSLLPATDPADPACLDGAEIGPYRILELLGRGGMGTVYLAQAPEAEGGALVAVKVLDRDQASRAFVRRFRLEREILAELDHPQIARYLGAGESGDGRLYLAMEYLEGRSLDAFAEEENLDLPGRLDLMARVCDVIQAAHEQLVVHRDVKPSNILVQAGGEVKLLDFGVAKSLRRDDEPPAVQTRPGGLPLTPEYASPELVHGEPVTAASDVYSLGVVLYRLVSGSAPYEVDGLPPHRLAAVIGDQHPIPPSRHLRRRRRGPLHRPSRSLLTAVDRVILKAIRKDPDQRYATAGDLAADLRAVLAGGRLRARPDERIYRWSRWVRRHRPLVARLALAAALLLAGGLVWLIRELEARQRTMLALHYGQKGEQIEAISRSMALQAGHSANDRRAAVRERIEGIEREMARGPRAGRGAAHYALGRGYLSLGEFRRARVHLEKAWQLGFQTPGAASLLGIALGEIYRRSLSSLEQITDDELRSSRRREIETDLRDPALAYLRRGLTVDDERAEYLAALMAFYQGELDDAERSARKVYAEAPWLYEARLLAANVDLERALASSLRQRPEESLPAFVRARDAYRAVQVLAPSEALAYSGECEAWAGIVGAEASLQRLEDEVALRGVEACEGALQLDELPETYVTLATVLRTWAGSLHQRGRSPVDVLTRSRAACSRAIELEPSSGRGFRELGNAFQLLAAWEASQGADPRDSLSEGLRALGQALHREPRSPDIQNSLGILAFTRGTWEVSAGIDPRASLTAASAWFERAAERSPSFLAPRLNLASTYGQLGFWELKTGRSPLESFQRAIEWSRGVVESGSATAVIHNTLGNLHLGIATYRFLVGDDPRPAIEEAVREFGRALAVAPAYALPHYHVGIARRLEAEYVVSIDDDPRPSLSASRQALGRALELNPLHAHSYAQLVDGHLVEARWLRRVDGEVAPKLAEAEAAARTGLELNPEVAQLHVHLAKVFLERMRSVRGRRPGERARVVKWTSSALASLETARRIDGTLTEPIVLEALIQLEQCRQAAVTCAEEARRVTAAVKTAAERSPSRRKLYEEWAAEAARAANAG